MNSDILFFRENRTEVSFDQEISTDCWLEIIHDCDIKHVNQENYWFRYTKENFVSFEELNNILFSNATIKKGIVECSYELSHILKMTNDITDMPINMSNYQFKCILTTLKYLKAVENKNMVKLFQALIFYDFVYHLNNGSKSKPLFLYGAFQDDFFQNFEFVIMKNFLFAFLNIFMMNYSFENGNLILLDKCRVSQDISLLNKNIPYKNIVIANFKVVYIFENILRNCYILYSFQALLNFLDIKSLIVDNYINLEIYEQNYNFAIFSIKTFKSISISNFTNQSSLGFLDKLGSVIRNDLEFLCLMNLQISRNAISLFLNQKRLKGLVLRNLIQIEDIDFIQDYTDCSKKLEYIEFKNVILKDTWWNYFLQVANVRKIILYFCTLLQQKNFMKEFVKIVSDKDVLYFEINFSFSGISVDFFPYLLYFRSLRTLKIYTYKNDSKNDPFLLEAIKNMKMLDHLVLQKIFIGRVFYNYLFQKSEIKVLHLKNIFFNPETPFLYFINNYKSLRKLVLTYIEVSSFGLIEIFKLENLIDLTLDFCVLHKTLMIPLQHLNFMSKKIVTLDLNNTNLEIFDEIDILGNLCCLESLNLSECMASPGYLARLSSKCNLRLKIISYESGILNSYDLNRLKNLEVLEEFNLSNCIFYDCKFSDLGKDCKFFNTLKKLDLWLVDIDIEDLKYFINFKNLEKLYLKLSGLNIYTIKKHLVTLPVYFLSIINTDNQTPTKYLFNYLYEESIMALSI
ncbi:hypothetical protein CWI37_1039p0020 [Hamiltosporidium tvaerminnensis]|uniref:Leucine-rich repeat-containing protein n=1 Tax=Hamiltosporidium tvaerminnensis TaxID=1176355 RepID=A0A4Q9L006_9MICR|nr:hypothetical protein CWI37_1039p0020 [Hamiltosporidium tvaerminnensis]